MTSEGDFTKKLEIKMEMLGLVKNDIPKILHRNKMKELEKTATLIENKLDKLQELKQNIQEQILVNEKSGEKVKAWGHEIESKFEKFELVKEELAQAIVRVKHKEIEKNRHDEAEKENIKLRKIIEEELIIEEEQLKRRSELMGKLSGASPTSSDREVKVKLPKLEIPKYNGTHLQWTRFWNQFSVEIDSSRLTSVTKLSYLNEFLEPKVRSIIDGLPFTSEGYNRAKSISEGEYGKPSEVANAHIHSIMNLPYIGNADPFKIHRFYEKLKTNINTLDTMCKLREIRGYVRFTLDKLGGIRADLLRMYDNWQNWHFSEFIEALRKRTERNPISVTADRNKEHLKKDRMLQTLQKQ